MFDIIAILAVIGFFIYFGPVTGIIVLGLSVFIGKIVKHLVLNAIVRIKQKRDDQWS